MKQYSSKAKALEAASVVKVGDEFYRMNAVLKEDGVVYAYCEDDREEYKIPLDEIDKIMGLVPFTWRK